MIGVAEKCVNLHPGQPNKEWDQKNVLRCQGHIQKAEEDSPYEGEPDHCGDLLDFVVYNLDVDDCKSIAQADEPLVEEDIAREILHIKLQHIEIEATNSPDATHGNQIVPQDR